MSRYRIIDIEHIKSCFKSQIAAQKAIDQLVYNPLVLSEEDSLSKFKEIWDAGSDDCYYTTNDRCDWKEEPRNWEEFKKTL